MCMCMCVSVCVCECLCVCVCVDTAAARSDSKLTMWNQEFPFLTTSNVKATWSFKNIFLLITLIVNEKKMHYNRLLQ